MLPGRVSLLLSTLTFTGPDGKQAGDIPSQQMEELKFLEMTTAPGHRGGRGGATGKLNRVSPGMIHPHGDRLLSAPSSTHAFTHSFIHSLIHSLLHLLIHSLNLCQGPVASQASCFEEMTHVLRHTPTS